MYIFTHDAYARNNEKEGATSACEGNESAEKESRASTPATHLDWSVNILFRAELDLHTKWPLPPPLFSRLDSTGRICRGYKQITISCIEDGTSSITQNFYSNNVKYFGIFSVCFNNFFSYLFVSELIYSFNLTSSKFLFLSR